MKFVMVADGVRTELTVDELFALPGRKIADYYQESIEEMYRGYIWRIDLPAGGYIWRTR